MKKKEYLNEENYQKGKQKLLKTALTILLVGILLGGISISIGIVKQININSQFSEESKINKKQLLESEKQEISKELEIEKQNITTSKTNLEEKIKPTEDQIKSLEREEFTGFNDEYYARKDKIEELENSIKSEKNSIQAIDNALDESFEHCYFPDTKNNSYTSKYCSLKNQLLQKINEIENIDSEFSEFDKNMESSKNIPFYIFGAFIIIVSCMFAGSVYMIAKRREIMAFTTQQVMPIAQEGMEKMAPTIGKAGATVAKKMAPAYGDIAKEVSKGIKEGLNSSKKEK